LPYQRFINIIEEKLEMKKLYITLTMLLIAMLAISPVYAGGVSIKIGLGSLIADITAWGLPNNTDYTFTLSASGVASVVCTNYGGNQAPGQNYPHVDGRDSNDVPQNDILKGGKVTTSLEAIPYLETHPDISWSEGGCPNSNWNAKVDFVFWDTAELQIVSVATGEVTTYKYSCVTTKTGPNSTPSTFDDGRITCKQIG
jgi:hypothetical protein